MRSMAREGEGSKIRSDIMRADASAHAKKCRLKTPPTKQARRNHQHYIYIYSVYSIATKTERKTQSQSHENRLKIKSQARKMQVQSENKQHRCTSDERTETQKIIETQKTTHMKQRKSKS